MKNYIAKETKSFTDGQAVADIITGNRYQADKEQEYFIGEFGNTIYLSQGEFDTYFKSDTRASHRKATIKYCKENVKVVYLRLYPSDKDIIEFLDTIKEPTRKDNSRAGANDYIRKLIREDMQRQKGSQQD